MISIEPKILIAAYTDELDCVAMLEFPKEPLREYSLSVGSRLLTVNVYERKNKTDSDLIRGMYFVTHVLVGNNCIHRHNIFVTFRIKMHSKQLFGNPILICSLFKVIRCIGDFSKCMYNLFDLFWTGCIDILNCHESLLC